MEMTLDPGKCTGCRYCEAACSLKHYENIVNPKKSRIRIFIDEKNDLYFPVIAGPIIEEECTSKNTIIIEGKEYDTCDICRASCPSRPWFKEADTGVPLKCDFCGDPPDPECVKVCPGGALTFSD